MSIHTEGKSGSDLGSGACSQRPSCKGLLCDAWLTMLTDSRLLTEHIGVMGLTARECKLLFTWSRMLEVRPRAGRRARRNTAITA